MTNLTTRQKLSKDPWMAHVIDERVPDGPLRWHALQDSREIQPHIEIIYTLPSPDDFIKITYTEYHGD